MQLRQNGFVIRPDDYIEMLKVVEKFGGEDIEDLGPRFCPLIATSPEEQERFYKVFEDYKTLPAPELLPPLQVWWNRLIKHFSTYKKHWLIGAGILLLIALLYIVTKPPTQKITANFTITKLSAGDTDYRVGDTVLMDATAAFPDPASSQKAQFFWNTGNGFVEDAPAIKTVLKKEGDFTVQLKVRSSVDLIKDSFYMETIPVCPQVRIPHLDYETQYTTGQVLQLNAGPFQKENHFQQVYWKETGSRRRS
jgi:hypothetical protein